MSLLVDLFCAEREPLIKSLLDSLGNEALSTVTGVFLFALVYLVGASVARVANDFFNDDDLGLGISEDLIRSAVYCNPSDTWLIPPGAVLTDTNGNTIDSKSLCAGDPDKRENIVRQAFSVQEAWLLTSSAVPTDSPIFTNSSWFCAEWPGMVSSLPCSACSVLSQNIDHGVGWDWYRSPTSFFSSRSVP
jgi:hypothetical protein